MNNLTIEELIIERTVKRLNSSIDEADILRRRMCREDFPYYLYKVMDKRISIMSLRIHLLIKIVESNPKYHMFKYNGYTIHRVIEISANTIYDYKRWNRGCRDLDILIGD